MNFIELSLDSALQRQSLGEITLIDASPSSLEEIPHNDGKLWKENFQRLCLKVRHLPVTKVIGFFKPKYKICIPNTITEDESVKYTWRYLYGVENKDLVSKTQDSIEYVYVLTNPEYPDLVKIGMTTDNVLGRVKGINNASTLSEWEPIFALPVEKGKAFDIEQAVHKHFESQRVSSNKGSKREFFTLSPFTAFDKVREIGSLFQVGEPIIF